LRRYRDTASDKRQVRARAFVPCDRPFTLIFPSTTRLTFSPKRSDAAMICRRNGFSRIPFYVNVRFRQCGPRSTSQRRARQAPTESGQSFGTAVLARRQVRPIPRVRPPHFRQSRATGATAPLDVPKRRILNLHPLRGLRNGRTSLKFEKSSRDASYDLTSSNSVSFRLEELSRISRISRISSQFLQALRRMN